MNYALGSGSLFNVNDESEYVHTLVCEYEEHGSRSLPEWSTLVHSLSWPSQLLSWILLMSHYATPYTACALDRYFELRVKEVELKEEVEIDPRLTSIVERMLDR